MHLPTLLRKELAWSRHRLVPILLLLLILPGLFAAGTVFFQHTFPENTPVAVVPTENATEDDLTIVTGSLTLFSDPVRYNSTAVALSALEREQVYAVIEVPGELGAVGETKTITLHMDGRVTPYRVPSRAIVGILSSNLDRTLPGEVRVRRHVIGAKTPLSTYLLPIFLMLLVMLLAFTYIPYNVATEESVIERLLIESSLDSVLAAKFLFFTPLVLLSILSVYGVGNVLEYQLEPISIPLVGSYLVTFLYLSAFSVSVMLVTDFSVLGRVLNVAIFFLVVLLSNLVYPAGFFSSWGLEIARTMPTHYSMIIARSHMLKGSAPGTFADWWVWLGGVTVGSFALLKLTIEWYEHTE